MVAERAGVSRGTVDRVLNCRPHVKPEIIRRVIRAMKELGYIPPKQEQAAALGLLPSFVKPCKIGVLLPNWQGYFKKEILRGIVDAKTILRDSAVEVLVEQCETSLPGESVDRLCRLAEKQVQGVAMCAMDNRAIAEKAAELSSKGIAVITFNSDLTGADRLCFVGQDLQRGGRVAGELMAKLLKKQDKLFIAIGNPEFDAHRLRFKGFCERMYEKGFSGENMIITETYNDYTLTYRRVSQALCQTQGIQGIYMANDSVAGCAEAVCDLGLKGKIRFVSHDLTDETRQYLKSGVIDFTIGQNIYQQGFKPLLLLRDYIQKRVPPALQEEYQAIEIICAENLI